MLKNSSLIDISKILNEYAEGIQYAISIETKKMVQDAKKELKKTSPKRKKRSSHRGKYSKGWSVEFKEGIGFIKATIHNRTDYQLTHLLEHGHLTRTGTKTKAILHITPIHDELVNRYEKKIENIIKNGG